MRTLKKHNDGISLKNMFPGCQFFGANDVHFQSCSGDWKDCQPDDLFVAMVDENRDGHDLVEQAIKRGASAILGERLLAVDVPQCIVANSRNAYARICQTLAGNPSQYLKTIGVTGSDGKTTVSHLLQSILAVAGEDVAITSSLKTSGKTFEKQTSYPIANQLTPPDLANWLCNSALYGCGHAIFETTSLQLANYQLSGSQLDAAVITNIRGNRLDYHNSVNNYRQVTLRILDSLKPTGFAAVNLDDPVSNQIVNGIKCPTITYAIKQEAELTATPVDEVFCEQSFMLSAGNESALVRTEIIGRNHIYNCLAAGAVALALGIELPTIVRGLENVKRISGRLERVECGQEFAVFIDSANSARRLASTLASLKRNTTGKLYCVAACNGLNADHRRELGRIIERMSSVPIISAPLVTKNQQLELAHQVLDGFTNPSSAQVIPNRVDAIEWALGQAKPGDCVAVTGFGEKPVYSLDDGRWELSDREICQAWLYEQPISPILNTKKTDVFRIDDFRR